MSLFHVRLLLFAALLPFCSSAQPSSTSLGARIRTDRYPDQRKSFSSAGQQSFPFSCAVVGIQYDMDYDLFAGRISAESGFPVNIDCRYELKPEDGASAYKDVYGKIRYSHTDFLIDARYCIPFLSVHRMYVSMGGGLRLASRKYTVDYDEDAYTIVLPYYTKDFQLNRKITDKQLVVRTAFGYEYQLDRFAFFGELMATMSPSRIDPMSYYNYPLSIGLSAGIKFFITNDLWPGRETTEEFY